MRNILRKVVFMATVAIAMVPLAASAFTLGSATRNVGGQINRQFIAVAHRTVGPYAGVVFCQANPSDCSAKRTRWSRLEVGLNEKRFAQLQLVNQLVNKSIRPQNDDPSAGGDVWSLAPAAGDCEDYALTKRHQLISMGWPTNALRLAVTYTAFGEGHMVLVVKTSTGDLVLDNRFDAIRRWDKTGLKWAMIQSASDPKKWMSVAGMNV